MIDKLDDIENRFHHVEERLSDPNIAADQEAYVKYSKEYKDLKLVVDAYNEYKKVNAGIENAQEMLQDDDQEMKEMAKLEIEELKYRKTELEEEIKLLLIPKDPEDEKDIIFEIRSGTGGDEASIFVGDLYRMYSKYFDEQKWKVEVIKLNDGTSGGYKEVVLEIHGDNVYGRLKFESGTHRVQRVPSTETKGRVHTSAATVAVIPIVEEKEINIRKDELRMDVFRASGAGGQHVNRTESGVRLTHIPTGVVAESTDSRSQHKNRDICMAKLYQRIQEAQRTKADAEQASKRKSMVGSGDRSEKIRTYNFPQNRLTDHRINLTLYNLDKVIEGDIGGIIDALQIAENAEKMQAES